MTVLPQLKQDLLEAAERTLPGEAVRPSRRWVSGGNLAAALSVGTALAVVVLAIVLTDGGSHSRPTTRPAARSGGSSLARVERMPYVQQLLRHFAVFRRSQTAADRAWEGGRRPAPGRFPTVAPVPGLTRLARTLDGHRIFLTVEKDYRPVAHAGERQPYSLELDVNLVGGRGGTYVAPWNRNVGDYLIVPVALGPSAMPVGDRRPSAAPSVAVGIVPDGVARIVWTYRCAPARARRCGGGRVETIYPRIEGNVAAATVAGDAPFPSVTWFDTRGRVVLRLREATPGEPEPAPFPGFRP